MSDIHALSGAYAVDALDDIERAGFERHLATCPECQEEVASVREATAALADDVQAAPPPELRAAVLAGITNEGCQATDTQEGVAGLGQMIATDADLAQDLAQSPGRPRGMFGTGSVTAKNRF